MPKFSSRSMKHLMTCHVDLQRLLKEVIKHYDITVLIGHRGKEAQNEAFRTGRSKLKYPKSKHNQKPSMAVDIIFYPADWNDREAFYHMAGYVQGTAEQMGIKIRWGGDWNSDMDFDDQIFDDLAHVELDP